MMGIMSNMAKRRGKKAANVNYFDVLCVLNVI